MKNIKSFFCTVFVLTLVTASSLQAQEPDIFFCVRPKACLETAFVKKVTALPEWEPFWTLFCDAGNKGIRKELNDRQQLEKVLPPKAIDMVARTLAIHDFSFRTVVENIVEHLEAVILMADINDARKVDGVLALIADVDPSIGLVLLPLLNDFTEKIDYTILKRGTNGDFIVKFFFRLPQQNLDIEFCCAGLKLPGQANRYALLFSNEKHIQKYFDAFKEGRTGEQYAAGYAHKITVRESAFHAIAGLDRPAPWAALSAEILDKIKGVEFGVGDKEGITQVELRFSLRQPEDAQTIRDMFAGAIALAQLSAHFSPETTSLLQTINIESNGNDVVAMIKLDHPELWKKTSSVLNKASDGIRKKHE